MIKKQYKTYKPYIKYTKIEPIQEPSFELFKDIKDIPLFCNEEKSLDCRKNLYKIHFSIRTKYIKDNEKRNIFFKEWKNITNEYNANYSGKGKSFFSFEDDKDYIDFYNKNNIFLLNEIENKNMQIIEFYKQWN